MSDKHKHNRNEGNIRNKRHEHDHERRLRRRSHRLRVRPTPWSDRRERDEVGLALLNSALVLLSSSTRRSSSSTSSSWKGGHGCPEGERKCHDEDDDESASAAKTIERTLLPRVSVWRIRSPGGAPLPHEVETTACLAEVALRDHHFRYRVSRRGTRMESSSGPLSSGDGKHQSPPTTPPPPSGMELRLLYSAAIIRGVNGLADAAQDNRRNLPDGPSRTLSVSLLCRRMGLPGWIVDVRHDAAHSPDLPSLPCLRMAATTMVEFLADAYWRPMREATSYAEAAAADLLRRYRAAAKGAAVAATPPDVTPSSFSGGRTGTDGKRPQGSVETKLEGAKDGERGGKSKKTKDIEATRTTSPPPSPLECAREFVLSTTPDVGIRVAVSFLVRGGGEVEVQRSDLSSGQGPPGIIAGGRGVLIPGSSSTFPETDVGIARIRERYLPLLTTVQDAWPGFLHALLVDMVDFVLGIVDNEDSEGGVSWKDVQNGVDAHRSAARRRKLFFLTSWTEYLLSAEFHGHLRPTTRSPDGGPRGDDGGEATGRGTTSTATATESASVSLRRANLPLNGLCDRCCDALSSIPASSPSHSILSGLVDLFEGALHGSRVEGMGLGGRDQRHHRDGRPTSPSSPPRRGNHRKRGREGDELEAAERVVASEETSSTDGTAPTGKNGAADGVPGGGGDPMSLEEMEAMLLQGDEDEDDDVDDGRKDPMGRKGASLEGNPANQRAEEEVRLDRTPWRKCAAWDPCSIGSMPGYPFRTFSKSGIR